MSKKTPRAATLGVFVFRLTEVSSLSLATLIICDSFEKINLKLPLHLSKLLNIF